MAVFKTVSPAGLAKKIREAAGKYGKNNTPHTLPAFQACAWETADGSLQLAEADNLTADSYAGVVYQDILSGALGLIIHEGKLPGALAGLGAIPGQQVFLSNTPGQLTLVAPPITSAIIRIGFAEPADGVNDGSANDLLVAFEPILTPS